MKTLVVTADDFGLSPGVVDGILEAHERGIVTSTSLLVNAPAAGDAFRAARETPSLAVGLHFVLSFGEPLGPREPLAGLLDDDGRFRRPLGPAHEAARAEHVSRELGAQLEHFEASVGRPPTHIDGHHHVHALPGVLEAVIVEAKARGVPVRAPGAPSRDRLRSSGVRTTDAFVSTFFGEGQVDEPALLGLLDELAEGTTELMCHPARPDERLGSLSSYVEPRAAELEALVSPSVRRAIVERGIALVPWTSV